MVSDMVSCYSPQSGMYQKNPNNNLGYGPAPPHWYLPPTYAGAPASSATAMHHHHHMAATNGQYFSGLESDMAAYYNQHHSMYSQASPDWSAHDNYGQSMLMPSLMPTVSTMPNGPHSNVSTATSGSVLDDQLEHLNGSVGVGSSAINHDIPPSPPNTVGSGCSEMSSPTISQNNAVNDRHAMHDNNNDSPQNTDIGRSKSPYEWMKKTPIQPLPGLFCTICSSLQIDSSVLFFLLNNINLLCRVHVNRKFMFALFYCHWFRINI